MAVCRICLLYTSMDKLTQAEKDRINKNLGLDQPVVIRYTNWLSEVSHGNFGYSYACLLYTSGMNGRNLAWTAPCLRLDGMLLTSPNVMHSCLDGEARLMQIMICLLYTSVFQNIIKT